MCALQTIGTSSSSSGITASYLNQLISATMAKKQSKLTALQKEQDALNVQKAVYTDLQTYLGNLDTAALALGSGSTSVTAQKSVSVSDSSYVTASASDSAANGTYSIQVSQLAAQHSVVSGVFQRSDTALNLSGTFYLGGAQQRSADTVTGGVIGGSTLVSSVDKATFTAPAAGQTELASGTYSVEFQKQSGSWMFRIVDGQGQAVSVKDAGSTNGAFTSGWQAFDNVKSQDFDSGRGLKFHFGDFSAGETGSAYLGTDAPSIAYVAQGAAITVDSSDSLQAICSKINGARYLSHNQVTASVVNNQLVLTAGNTGYQLEGADGTGTVLTQLGLRGGTDADGDGWNGTALGGWIKNNDTGQYELAKTKLSVNGLAVTTWSNSSLTNVINGLTLNLLKTTSSAITVAVSDDNSAVTNQIRSFATQFNKVTSYLSDKTKVTKNTDGTYTRGALAEDSVMNSLRYNLISDLVKPLDSGTLKSLSEIGLTFDVDTMQLSLSDSSKLATQLQTNRKAVTDLLAGIVARVDSRLQTFTGTSGVLSTSIKRMDGNAGDLTSQISDEKDHLKEEEQRLTDRYSRLLAQYAEVQSNYSTMYSLTVNTSA